VAVINSYPLERMIQQFPSIRSQLVFDSSGAMHLAAIQITLQLEFFEDAESFAPIETSDLEEADIQLTTFPPFGATNNLEDSDT
jgi:hypothetical protein